MRKCKAHTEYCSRSCWTVLCQDLFFSYNHTTRLGFESPPSVGFVIFNGSSPGWQQEGGRLVEKLGCRGLAVVLGAFSIELRGKDVSVKLLVVVFQLVSVDEHLEQKHQLLEAFETVDICYVNKWEFDLSGYLYYPEVGKYQKNRFKLIKVTVKWHFGVLWVFEYYWSQQPTVSSAHQK